MDVGGAATGSASGPWHKRGWSTSMREYLTPSCITRFWAKVEKSDGCWLWCGNIPKSHGYGTFWIDRHITLLAHRLSWTLAYGEIPAGLIVCHSCDINYPVGDITYRRCVRPDHLWIGTNAENIADMVCKGRSASGSRSGARLHPERLARGERSGARLHPERVARGERRGSARLTESQAYEILRLHRQGSITGKALAARFGVTGTCISCLINGKTWTHLRREE